MAYQTRAENDEAKVWFFQLSGHDADLKALQEAFRDGDIRVSREEGQYFLSSPRFEGLSDANAARDAALLLVAILNGARAVGLNGTEPVSIGYGSFRETPDTRPITLFAGFGEDGTRGTPAGLTAILSESGGQRDSDAAVKEWACLALENQAVAKVVRLNATPPLDWFDVYRILEVIADDVGGTFGKGLKRIASRGWMPLASAKLLMRTSGSVDAIGLEARHAVQQNDPPPNPMPIGEARKLVRRLAWRWLESKAGHKKGTMSKSPSEKKKAQR